MRATLHGTPPSRTPAWFGSIGRCRTESGTFFKFLGTRGTASRAVVARDVLTVGSMQMRGWTCHCPGTTSTLALPSGGSRLTSSGPWRCVINGSEIELLCLSWRAAGGHAVIKQVAPARWWIKQPVFIVKSEVCIYNRQRQFQIVATAAFVRNVACVGTTLGRM